jgi:hypothetical protein
MVATLLIISYAGVDNQDDIAYIIIDMEDKSEPTEDKKGVTDYTYDQHRRFNFSRHAVSDYSKFNQFTSRHLMEVCIEILTPPPEA